MRILTESQIRELITVSEARSAVRDAFVALAEGKATLPAPLELDFPHQHGDLHVKGAFMPAFPFFAFKVICGFYENARRGLPVASGTILVFDSDTGALRAQLFDNGFLTDLRTGAAGALAAELLANPDIERLGIIGAGTQARYQLEALLDVRRPEEVVIHARRREQAENLASWIRGVSGIPTSIAPTIEAVCRDADLIVTTTPTREPLVHARSLQPGVHVTAVGSDIPSKQELDASVLARADVVVADSIDQCASSGEIHHAIQAGAIDRDAVRELGLVASGAATGRTSREQITIADLTGVGVQDVAVANVVVTKAEAAHVGSEFALTPR